MLTKTTLVKLRRNVMVSLSRLFVRRTREKLEGSKVWQRSDTCLAGRFINMGLKTKGVFGAGG